MKCEKTCLDGRWNLVGTTSHFLQHLLEILGPLSDRQLGNLDSSIVNLVNDTVNLVLVGLCPFDCTLQISLGHAYATYLETSEPRRHLFHFLAIHESLEVIDNFGGVVVGDLGRPS